jgi:cobalt/nickel transport system permease protein
MAFIIPTTGYYLYNLLSKLAKTEKGSNIVTFISSYAALNIGALFTAVEFGIQPLLFKDSLGMPLYCPYPLGISIPSMMIPHLTVAGVLEGIITVGVLSFIRRVSPGIIYDNTEAKTKPVYAFIIVLILLSPLGLLASGTAWGEWGVDEISSVNIGGKALGFIPKGMKNGFSFKSFMSDYSLKGLPESLGYILSAIAGVAILLIIFRLISSSKKESQ